MILREMQRAEVYRIDEGTALKFGNDAQKTKIADIDIAISERSVAEYDQNNQFLTDCQYLGLTKADGIEKGMIIETPSIVLRVEFVQKSKRFYQIFMTKG